MKKSGYIPVFLLCLTVVGSLAGFLLRFAQYSAAATGGGDALGYGLLALTLPVLLGLGLLSLLLEKKEHAQQVFSSGILPNGLLLLAAVLLLGGNLLQLFSETPLTVPVSGSPRLSAFLSGSMAPLGILAAFCLGAFSISRLCKKTPSPLLFMGVSLYLVVRLIGYFQIWNTDPSVWEYCYCLLSAISTMLASFHLAGFSFGKGKRRLTVFWCLAATVTGAVSLGDHLANGQVLYEILLCGGLLLTMGLCGGQLLFCRGKAPEPPVQEDASGEEE